MFITVYADRTSKQEMQEWRSGESARLRPLLQGFFPGFPVFLPPQKPTLQSPIRYGNEGHRFVSFAVSVTLAK